MQKTLYNLLFVNKRSIVAVLLVFFSVFLFLRQYTFTFNIIFFIVILWAAGFSLKSFGYKRVNWLSSIPKALILTVWMFLLLDIAFQPLLEHYLGRINISMYDTIRGNVRPYIQLALQTAFLEIVYIFLFRGYVLKRVVYVLGDTDYAWFKGIILVSVLMSIPIYTMGITAFIIYLLTSLYINFVFYHNQDNIILVLLLAIFYDTFILTSIYFSMDNKLVEFIQIWLSSGMN